VSAFARNAKEQKTGAMGLIGILTKPYQDDGQPTGLSEQMTGLT
jgi:hypothetical protein